VYRDEIAREQEYVDTLYARVDQLRERTAERIAALLEESTESPQARLERDATATRYAELRSALDAAENGLCFGRIDLTDGRRQYVGRIGVRADSNDAEPLLLDWRAPAARLFYTATSAAPNGVHRRRHIASLGRRVVDVNDELLDHEKIGDEDGLVGEAALLAALEAERTGRMRDIVATLQAEQDEAIRADHRGVLVVQGGPGTGKTVVALHRAAYLLYTHLELAKRGVLVVGPNTSFLSYISQVLPGLGETRAVLSTVADLYPGVSGERAEPESVAAVKGRPEMAEVVATAVRDRQATERGAVIEFEGDVLTLSRDFLADAAELARRTRLPHNRARTVFLREVVTNLTEQVADLARTRLEAVEADLAEELARLDKAIAADLERLPGRLDVEGVDVTGEVGYAERRRIRRRLGDHPDVHLALDRLWPLLTPETLLDDLFADPDRLVSAAAGLSEADRDLLARSPGGGWSEADVPLLDEAADLLGEDPGPSRVRDDLERAADLAYAQGVLDLAAGADDDEEVLSIRDLVSAEHLAERQRAIDHRTLSERATGDRTWAFGHLIVDEAQELSPMAWRLLMRRCPTRSATVVGDVLQTGSPAGASSWREVLAPHVGDRWRLAELTVNYRTPQEIMAAARPVLDALDPDVTPPRAVRSSGFVPWRAAVSTDALPDAVAQAVERELALLVEGHLAVIAPDSAIETVASAVAAVVPDVSPGPLPDLQRRVVVLGVRRAKGLEFDSVLLADPAGIVGASSRGLNDLFVALTRATQRLGVLHVGSAPSLLAGLATVD
jgi:DNA helicase IV